MVFQITSVLLSFLPWIRFCLSAKLCNSIGGLLVDGGLLLLDLPIFDKLSCFSSLVLKSLSLLARE